MKERTQSNVTSTPLHCVPDRVTNERKWVKDWERRDLNKKLHQVSGPKAYQFSCSWQEICSLTTVGQRRLLSQSYSVLDGFNLEQLVDDEPIHMVYKSLSVSSAINLQDSLHLSSTLTDSSAWILQNISIFKTIVKQHSTFAVPRKKMGDYQASNVKNKINQQAKSTFIWEN